jgi:serine/threonine protein kinase
MVRMRAGSQLGAWTLQADPTSRRALKGPPVEVWWAADDQGREGVLKYCANPAAAAKRRNPTYARKRFELEVRTMRLLQGAPGVLPVLDIDPTPASEWFVTQKATLLGDHFGTEPSLWSVVEAIADIAATLTDILKAHDITHRDIKPDNLFWLNGRPLVGDFGIAFRADNARLTDAGRKVGPWGYIAHEALNNDDVHNWAPADVHALAKCLWKFATAHTYPPQGPLYLFEETNTLYWTGGKPALELGRLLEASTSPHPRERPTMRDFRDELRCWLNDHPTATIETKELKKISIWTQPGRDFRQASRAGEDAIAEHCVRDILKPLRPCLPGSTILDVAQAADLDPGPQIIHSVTGGDPDWAPEFSETLALESEELANVRVIVQGLGDNEDATYFGQWQTRASDESPWQPATPMRHTSGRMWFPTDFSTRAWMSSELAADSANVPAIAASRRSHP